MHEELAEYEEAVTNENSEDAIEELADLLELIHAAASVYDLSMEELE